MGMKARGKKNSLKTKQNNASVIKFLSDVENIRRAKDAVFVCDLMERLSGEKPKMWGDSIVGFGSYHYTGSGGREGDWPLIGFSPRKASLSVYCMPGFDGLKSELKKLGRHKHSVSCLYLSDLSKIEVDVLETIVKKSLATMRERYPKS